MATTVIWIPVYGLLGVLISLPWTVGLVPRSGGRPAAYINILMTVMAVVHSGYLLEQVWGQAGVTVSYDWLSIYDLQLSLTLVVSPVTVGTALVGSAISLCAQVYGLASMEMDWSLARFYALMSFFESALMAIALSDSLFVSYGFLEMLTLSTYLLVGFWYAQPAVVTAARDAFWTKRLGDLLLLMGVIALSSLAGSLNFSELAEWAKSPATQAYFHAHPLVGALLGLALIAGPTGKCAQFPLHLWLDEAMEGPNPASILRNSAVVGAGAYVLIQLQPVLALSPIASQALIWIGSITAVGAVLVSIAQIDIKRAFSHTTSAYLGLVFVAVGVGAPEAGLSLLFSFVWARALLFTAVGAVMLFSFTQDLTEMGGLGKKMPATAVAYLVGAMASVGIVPLGGFWGMLSWLAVVPPYLAIVLLLVNGVTAFGMVRVFALVFAGKTKPRTRRVAEVPWLVAVPMIALAIVNLLVPVLLWQWQLLPQDINYLSLLALIGSGVVGMVIGSVIYLKQYGEGSTVPVPSPLFLRLKKPIQEFFANDLQVRTIYQYTIVSLIAYVSQTLTWIDRHLVDGLTNLVGMASIFSGESLRYTITGRSQQYVLTILVGILLVAVISFWRWQSVVY